MSRRAPQLRFDQLSPLFKPTWQGPEAAMRCIAMELHGCLEKTVERHYHNWDAALYYLSPDDLLHELVIRLRDKVVPQGGFDLPEAARLVQGPGGPSLSPTPATSWICRVAQNALTDILREQRGSASRSARHGSEEPPRLQRDGREPDELPSNAPSPETLLIEHQRAWHQNRRARHILARLRRHVPPVPLLAWLLLKAPELVDASLVQAAANFLPRGHRSQAGGLARSAQETWKLLLHWRERFGDEPSSRAARRALAWILRSTDQSDPESWRRQHPSQATTALATLSKWQRRAQQKIDALSLSAPLLPPPNPRSSSPAPFPPTPGWTAPSRPQPPAA